MSSNVLKSFGPRLFNAHGGTSPPQDSGHIGNKVWWPLSGEESAGVAIFQQQLKETLHTQQWIRSRLRSCTRTVHIRSKPMKRRLALVDLGKATKETKQFAVSPIFYDGVSYQYFRPWW
jgi:hypothetical protein